MAMIAPPQHYVDTSPRLEQLVYACDQLDSCTATEPHAPQLCQETCQGISQIAKNINSTTVADILTISSRCFQLRSPLGWWTAQLCEAASKGLAAVAAFLSSEAATTSHRSLAVPEMSSLIVGLDSTALPRLTDSAWASSMGAQPFARYMQACTDALATVSTMLLVTVPESTVILCSSSELLRCLGKWVALLLRLASSALALTKAPDTPAELRAFFLVNTSWKQVVRVAGETSPDARAMLPEPCFQTAFETAWKNLEVRSGQHSPACPHSVPFSGHFWHPCAQRINPWAVHLPLTTPSETSKPPQSLAALCALLCGASRLGDAVWGAF